MQWIERSLAVREYLGLIPASIKSGFFSLRHVVLGIELDQKWKMALSSISCSVKINQAMGEHTRARFGTNGEWEKLF